MSDESKPPTSIRVKEVKEETQGPGRDERLALQEAEKSRGSWGLHPPTDGTNRSVAFIRQFFGLLWQAGPILAILLILITAISTAFLGGVFDKLKEGLTHFW